MNLILDLKMVTNLINNAHQIEQSAWPAKCLEGKAQSPINIRTTEVTPNDLGDLEFEYYFYRPLSQTITNDGHTGKRI